MGDGGGGDRDDSGGQSDGSSGDDDGVDADDWGALEGTRKKAPRGGIFGMKPSALIARSKRRRSDRADEGKEEQEGGDAQRAGGRDSTGGSQEVGARVVVPFDYEAAEERRRLKRVSAAEGEAAADGTGRGGRGARGAAAGRGGPKGRGGGGRDAGRGRGGGRGRGDSLLGKSPYSAGDGVKMMRGGKRSTLTPSSGNRTYTFK